MCRAPFRDRGRSKRDYLTSTSALWGFAPNPLLGESTNAGHRPASPRRGKVHGEGETPAQGGKPSAYLPSDSESRSDALAGVQFAAKRT